MTPQHDLRDLLDRVARGELDPDAAARLLMGESPAREGVRLDVARRARTGLPEVVMGSGKTAEQITACVAGLADGGEAVLATRVAPDAGLALCGAFPRGAYHAPSRLFALDADLGLDGPQPERGEVVVVTAGTSDLPVALEAVGSARFFGLDCGLVADVGVAGVHRLERRLPVLASARLVIAVAGMDGALASVLAGLVRTPLVAVPSSQGGENPLGALSALLAMHNACAPGVVVANIDNGFGAAAFAAKLLSGRTRGS